MTQSGRVVRGRDLVPRPWPNGLGTTRDVAREDGPDGRVAWLISVADLVQDAPFSHFPDADRVFTVVEGDAIALVLGDDPPVVSAPLVPTFFPGDRPTASRLTGRPGRAFNVFVDRRAWRASVAAMNLAAGHAVAGTGDVAAAYCLAGRVGAGNEWIGPGDTWIGPAGAGLLAEDGPAALLQVAFIRR